ncbi:MAG: Rrf2 family transcriptional regulator, partial [Alphaproteobacteria bacterium]|nr:Rrf2 family transcriptional regulator [Alphaproteobacteria bacterium]
FAGLRRHGLVKSHRGPGGGYELAKPASEISVAAIIRAADDSHDTNKLGGNIRRQRQTDPSTEILWEHVGSFVFKKLEAISLEDVITERSDVYQKTFRLTE